MGARFGAFYHTKYSESHDNMTQIILPSKINCIDTSDETQYHQKDTAQTKIAHCMDTSNEIQYHHKTCTLDSPINSMCTSNEIQYHPFCFWG